MDLTVGSDDKDYLEKILIICLDADDDIGKKTGLKTPIIGRDKLIEAGNKIALADPEEADANAIFAAVSNYDKLVSKGHEVQVAIVSGDFDDKILASKKMIDEIKEINNLFEPKSTYIVTDGFSDEDIIPVISANVPLKGIIRVIIKHSRSVEESYLVLGRYLKMLFTDSRFKKYSLGIPGLILVLLPMLAYIGRILEALLLLSIAIGASAFIRGFGLDKTISTLMHKILDIELPPVYYIGTVILYFSGTIFIIAGLALGTSGTYEVAIINNITTLMLIIANLSTLIGEFIKRSALFLVIGFVFLVGRDFIIVLQKSPSETKTHFLKMAAVASLYPFLIGVGDTLISFDAKFLSLVYNSFISIISMAVTSAIILISYKVYEKHLKDRH